MSDAKYKKVFGIIKLKPGISIINYFSIVAHNIVLGFFQNGIELLQQDILVDANYYNLPNDDAIESNANITLFDLVVKLLVTGIYGSLIDKLGRRKMVAIGYIVTTLGILLFPIHGYFHSLDSIFPWYYMARFVYANGAIIIILMPFVADYIQDESKGKAAGINAVASTVGFLICTAFLGAIYGHGLDMKFIYIITAAISFFFGMLYAFFLKGGSEYYSEPQTSENPADGASRDTNTVEERPQKITFRYIVSSIKERPWIQASFIFALLNGANLGIVSQVLSLFVRNLSNNSDPSVESQVVEYSNYGGIISTIIHGILLDYIAPFYVAVSTLLLSLAGYCAVLGVSDVNSPLLIFVAIASGLGYSNCQLLMNYLGFVYYPSSVRGRLYAIANFICCLGNLLITVVGGNLVRFTNYAPFYLMIGCSLVGFVSFMILYLRTIRKSDGKRKKVVSEDSHYLLSSDKSENGINQISTE